MKQLLWTPKVLLGCFLLLCVGLWIGLTETCFAVNLETQLDQLNTVGIQRMKKFGLSGATIAGGMWSLFKGNVKLAGMIVAVGVMLGFFIQWVEGGMAI